MTDLTADELVEVSRSAIGADRNGNRWRFRNPGDYPQSIIREGDATIICDTFTGPEWPPTIAEFIVRCDPPTVLRLVNELQRRRKEKL